LLNMRASYDETSQNIRPEGRTLADGRQARAHCPRFAANHVREFARRWSIGAAGDRLGNYATPRPES
jgi:hypothetical protein